MSDTAPPRRIHTLDQLIDAEEFTRRHIGPSDSDVAVMLDVIGVATPDELLDQTMPSTIRSDAPLSLPGGVSETEALARLRGLAERNKRVTSLIGMGYTATVTPPVIARNVLENPAWYTAYTPYQPEISQGRLEALLNFQTLVTELTGLDVANSSLLDEATAAAEAMTMARRQSKSPSNRFVVHHDTHPQTIAVLRTRAEPVGIDLVVGGIDDLTSGDGLFGAVFSLPTSSGAICDWSEAIAQVHELGGIAVVVTDPLGLSAVGVTRSARRRHRRGIGTTIRCADGFRRSPRRIPGSPRARCALDARTHRWRERRHRGPTCVAPRTPDSRTAHPAREGHFEHLHGAGPPRQHRRAVRRLARS